MTITITRDKLRLTIGDIDEDAPLFSDEELDFFLSERGDNFLLAGADACDALARKFARYFDFQTDDQRFQRSQMSAAYRALGQDLRDRASGVTSVVSTRVDGYSQDIDTESVNEADQNVRGRYRRLDDAPF